MGGQSIFMSRPNLKFKNVQLIVGGPGQIRNLNIFHENLGFVIFLYPGQIQNLKLSVRVGGLAILPCPGQIWNLYWLVRVGGQSSFHVQAKAEISIFQQRLDGWSS